MVECRTLNRGSPGTSVVECRTLNRGSPGTSVVECRTQPREPGHLGGRMPDSQSRESGFESPLPPFWRLGIFVLFTTPQFTQPYKWVPGYRRWWKYEWVVFTRNCGMVWMVAREVELVSEWTHRSAGGGGVKCNALWTVQRTGYMRYIKTYLYVFTGPLLSTKALTALAELVIQV